MKKNNYFHIILITIIFMGSCKQETIVVTDPAAPPTPATPVKGTADFTKFVALGNSFVAGMQSNALYDESQSNSLPRILARQFEKVGGPTTFNQPDINSKNGFNPIQSNLSIGLILGRLVLFDPDGAAGPRSAAPAPAKMPATSVTCPAAQATPAVPAPYNTADFPTAFTGNKSALNNFGVPLVYLAQLLTPATGGPAISANPAYSPFYGRFASAPSSTGALGSGSTMISDAGAAAGSFYLLWAGFDDVLLYAATGADGASPGTYPMTASATFAGQYNALINTFLTAPTLSSAKGVVGNIPNFTSLPFFYTVTWNAVTLDADKATALTTNLATGYNAFLDGMVLAGKITAAERDKRKLTYKAGSNPVLLTDEELTDLSPYMSASPTTAALVPYARARQATSSDLVVLTAGSILGTCNSNNANAIWGVSYPLTDNLVLTPTEIATILGRTADFNTTIATAVAASNNRLALADVNKAYADFVTAKLIVSDGISLTPSLSPPAGAFSEDGIHPNSRGYAFTANIFIDAINAKFSSTIPHASLANYSATGLPVNP